MHRRAKIVCTIGPATSTPERLRQLVEAGMDVARLNFSHGSRADHASVVQGVRDLAAAAGRPVAILQDLQGPKIRIGALTGGRVELVAGRTFVLRTGNPPEGDAAGAAVSYAGLSGDVQTGDTILMQDGLLRLEAVGVDGANVVCRVVDGGVLRERAGINLPGTELKVPSLTAKDRDDLAFGLAHQVDIVALSFVRRAEDMATLRTAAVRAGAPPPLLVAKLEKPQAIAALDSILAAADGVMVARGDLGVEVSPERVPFMQKTIIRRAAAAGVPSVTATQMLESMVTNPRPTRAEASDVANAVFDGTDAVMLSAETSIGAYPLEAVRMMDRIVRESERHMTEQPERLPPRQAEPPGQLADAVAEAAGLTARALAATTLVAFTRSGFTARLIAKHRPETPLVAYTPDRDVLRQLPLYWGIAPRLAPELEDTDRLLAWADRDLLAAGLVRRGDAVVFVAGAPASHRRVTNLIRVHRAGEPLA